MSQVKRVLVTGGAGYIGAVAVHALIEIGFKVSILDDCSTGRIDNIPNEADFFKGSLLDRDLVTAALNGCDAVMHFAGKSLVAESVEKPDLYEEVNVEGSAILIQQMRRIGVRKLVFSSSAATYGNVDANPISEDSPKKPTNPYGLSKLKVESLITKESLENGLNAISLRYFNVAGAVKTDSKWLYENHEPETHLIPNVLKSTSDNPIKVFGTDWPTPDGTCIRDYVHVVELIDAHVRALNILNGPGHEIVNLGSGSGYSVKDVLAAASATIGVPIPFVEADRRSGDPAILVADISKARRLLNWIPAKTMLQMVSDSLHAGSA